MPKISTKTGNFESLFSAEHKTIAEAKNITAIVQRNTSSDSADPSYAIHRAAGDVASAIDRFLKAVEPVKAESSGESKPAGDAKPEAAKAEATKPESRK